MKEHTTNHTVRNASDIRTVTAVLSLDTSEQSATITRSFCTVLQLALQLDLHLKQC